MVLWREIADLDDSRVSTVSAEDTLLRRLERGLHDGPHQSLLGTQYDLASALCAIGPGDGTVRPLVESAPTLAQRCKKD